MGALVANDARCSSARKGSAGENAPVMVSCRSADGRSSSERGRAAPTALSPRRAF